MRESCAHAEGAKGERSASFDTLERGLAVAVKPKQTISGRFDQEAVRYQVKTYGGTPCYGSTFLGQNM